MTDGYLPHKVLREDRADGSILLRSAHLLGPVARNTGKWLHRWAAKTPDAVFLAERSGAGWRAVSFGAALDMVRALAAGLLARGLGPATPILILSGNSVDHGLLSLAAQYVGVPSVPVAEQYSLIPEARDRLAHVADLVRPAMAYVSDAALFADALDIDALRGVECVASAPQGRPVTAFDDLLKGDASVDVDAAHARVGPDTVAKILMTSGSTSSPKGVLTTQRMMCVNQAQHMVVFPFLGGRVPRLLDWLPWNHVFGGSHNFNLMLATGGSLYINDGKPAKALFGRTLENLDLVTGTILFDVPMGHTMLLDAVQKDHALRARVFGDLDMIFYAGAAVPKQVWDGLHDAARAVTGRLPLMSSGWGLTETAPATLTVHEASATAGLVGVPLPGVTVKLIPSDERYEIRGKGPNVMPGYFADPVRTSASFDAEGFFITGDAVRFADPARAEAGLRFDGRLSEDFKLQTGTWVRVAALRAQALALLAPLAADLVVTGEGRAEIGVLVVPEPAALSGVDTSDDGGALLGLRDVIAERLAGQGTGSSLRIGRVLILAEPPSVAEGEITAKGNLNTRKLLTRRAGLVARLYDDADPAVIRV